MSRIGPHYLHPGTDNGAQTALLAVGATVFKSVDNLALLTEAKRRNPDVVTIARRYLGNGGGGDWYPLNHQHNMEPEAVAEMAWAWVKPYATHPSADYCEIENEPFINVTPAQLRWYSRYLIALIGHFNDAGAKACLINASTGTPESYVWRHLADAMTLAVLHGHALGLHEYAQPRIIGSFTSDWLWYRHKAALRELEAAGVDTRKLKIIITEFGVDGTIHEADTFQIDHSRKRGSYRDGVMSDDELIARCEAFDRDAAPQVIGACFYTVGANGDPRWDAFNISGTSFAPRFIELANRKTAAVADKVVGKVVVEIDAKDFSNEIAAIGEAAADEIDTLLADNNKLRDELQKSALRQAELEQQNTDMFARAVAAERHVDELKARLR